MNLLANLSSALIHEITAMVFDFPSPPMRPCDVIFIFGGSHPGLWQTTAAAFHKGLGRDVVVTGGHKPGVHPHPAWVDGDTPESHVIRRELVRLSVPEERIFFEDRSTNTLENVLFAREVYDFSAVRSILAVCKNYGVGRQCRTLSQRMGNAITVIPYPFDAEAGGSGVVVTRQTWMEHEKSRVLVLAQVGKIIRYGRLGHLLPVEHVSPGLEMMLDQFG